MTPPAPTRTTAQIIAETAERYAVSVDEIVSPRKYRHLSEPRSEAAFDIYMSFPNLSMTAIGRRFSNRDRAAIYHLIRQAAERRGLEMDEVVDIKFAMMGQERPRPWTPEEIAVVEDMSKSRATAQETIDALAERCGTVRSKDQVNGLKFRSREKGRIK